MAQAKLNSEFIATEAGDITVFNYDGETYEYFSSSVEYLAVGVGIPANSCTDAPGNKKKVLLFAGQQILHHGNMLPTTG